MERAVRKNEKLESFEIESLKMENFHLSWKASVLVPNEVVKFSLKFRSFAEVGKLRYLPDYD